VRKGVAQGDEPQERIGSPRLAYLIFQFI